jgi:hypothetical protein
MYRKDETKQGENFLPQLRHMEPFMQDLEEGCAKFQDVKDSLKKMMKMECERHASSRMRWHH